LKKLISNLLNAGVVFLILAYVLPFCVFFIGTWEWGWPSDWEPWYYRIGLFLAVVLSTAIIYTASKDFLESIFGDVFIRKILLSFFDGDRFNGDMMKITDNYSAAKKLTRAESLVAIGREIKWLLKSNSKKNRDMALAIVNMQAKRGKSKEVLAVESVGLESDFYIASSEVYIATCEDDGLTGMLALGVDHLFFYASNESYKSVKLSKVGKDAAFKISEKLGDRVHPLLGIAVKIAEISMSDNKKEFKHNLTNSISIRLVDIEQIAVTEKGFIGQEKLVEIKVKNSNGISSYRFGTFDEMDKDFSKVWLEKIELACLLCGSIINNQIGPKSVEKIESC
jgi:hypothetical protein